MISAQLAISKARRDLTLGAIVRWAMIAAAVAALMMQPLIDGAGVIGVSILFGVGALWMVLSFRSMRGSRVAADSSTFIAAGQFELAERSIAEALDSFSIFRSVKLLSLHHLAALRHAQNRWQDSALLCQAVLMQKPRTTSGLDRSSRLLLADSLLELGDLRGVHENLVRLYNQRLTLREALNLLVVQQDYLARISAWEPMLWQVNTKVQMAELLPTLQSARTQALMALAAKNTGRLDWFDWLRKRVELLIDVQHLCADRPMLSELWKQ
ncbi:MAG TPA: hypothetical protein VKK61_08590 [Tepidisphaeraceae bacterium]|nr:hypothetical protein [Tepidisphaeraceae bacterium]